MEKGGAQKRQAMSAWKRENGDLIIARGKRRCSESDEGLFCVQGECSGCDAWDSQRQDREPIPGRSESRSMANQRRQAITRDNGI